MSAISPKAAPGPIVATGLAVNVDGELAALDDEEHQSAFSLERQLVARGEAALVELVRKALEISLVEVGEQLDVT